MHLEQMTQHNAALVEQAAQAAAALATQAEALVSTVSLFRLSQAEKQQLAGRQADPGARPRRSKAAALLPGTASAL